LATGVYLFAGQVSLLFRSINTFAKIYDLVGLLS
jgi:hypothetical protein